MHPLVDKAIKLHEDTKSAGREAISQLIKDREAITEQLQALGYVENAKAADKKNLRPSDPNKVCSVCREKGHDGRYHRRRDPSVQPTKSAVAPASPK
jgi:hypothetical protein